MRLCCDCGHRLDADGYCIRCAAYTWETRTRVPDDDTAGADEEVGS